MPSKCFLAAATTAALAAAECQSTSELIQSKKLRAKNRLFPVAKKRRDRDGEVGRKLLSIFMLNTSCFLDFLTAARTLSPLYRWGLEGSEKLKNFLEVTEEIEPGT